MKVRMLLFAALAQDLAGDAHASVVSIGHITDDSPDATTPGMFQGIVGMSPNPTVAGDWPCFAGATTCASIAAGGLVIGEPERPVLAMSPSPSPRAVRRRRSSKPPARLAPSRRTFSRSFRWAP